MKHHTPLAQIVSTPPPDLFNHARVKYLRSTAEKQVVDIKNEMGLRHDSKLE